MAAPQTPRVLARVRIRQAVYLRSPDGQLSKAVVKYASGRILKTLARVFSRVTGEEVDVATGQVPYTLLTPTTDLHAEYEAQTGAAMDASRVRATQAKVPLTA